MSIVHRIVALVILLALWLGLSVLLPNFIPGPVPVIQTMWGNIVSGAAIEHLVPTLMRVGFGLVLTMVMGTVIGTIMGLSVKGELYLDSVVMVGLTVPAIVYGVICVIWFGVTNLAAIVAIALAAFPAVAISVWKGIKGIDPELVAMGRAFRLSRPEIIRKVIFPQLLPHMLAALRYALGICWKICTTVELIGMPNGVGYQINYWFGLFSVEQVFAWLLLFLLVMFAIEYAAFKPMERYMTRWRGDEPLRLAV
jgi:NitT/TauT family transport system permease protein